MKERIKVNSKVKVENGSETLRGREGFEDFEGIVKSIYIHPFGYSGEIKTEERIRVFDTSVQKIKLLT